MFGIVRLILGCIFLGCSVIIIKFNMNRKRVGFIISLVISVVLVAVLSFLPLENYFITFDSPKKAYEYYNLGKSDIELVVEGDESDFVVNRVNETDTYLIIPKSEDGWKIGIGSNTKRIIQKHSDEIVIYIYQYKNTNDYFITIFNTDGGGLNLSDNYNTKFYSLEKNNNILGKTFVTYYAHVPYFNHQYSILVDGFEIVFDN